jgi:hypothetical protein
LKASLGKKLARPHLTKDLGVAAFAYNSYYLRGKRIEVQDGLSINLRPCLKNN